ncbi:MAG: peptidase domain-containing ABC transporter, partial [Prevotellaceae bacterium]|nr:peptidase domain-containing ABC transporter [Prevotellaceae bacterium]
MLRFPFYSQHDSMDCGATCLRLISKHYGKHYSSQFLREKSFITREGVSMLGISEAAESIGFRTQGVKISLEQLKTVPLPCILHWNQAHFVVLYKVKKDKFYISDPVGEKYVLKKDELLKCWASTVTDGEQTGTALLLEPAPEFYTKEIDAEKNKKSISFFFRYLKPFKSQIAQLFIGLLVGSILSLIFPFLTQSIVDKGIGNNNL